MMLAARRLMELLRDQMIWDELEGRLPNELIHRCGRLVALCPAAMETLEAITKARHNQHHAMSVSILHATETGWVPTTHAILNLTDARLEKANWTGIELPRSTMRAVNFQAAVLDHVDFESADIAKANFNHASLRHATLTRADFTKANLSEADLTAAMAFDAKFLSADLSGAKLNCMCLRKACLRKSDLTCASLHSADLRDSEMFGARIEETDFSKADFSAANLRELSLQSAIFNGAVFRHADMIRCNLEEVDSCADFSSALLTGALFTGSTLHGSDFRRADLRHCGLADIDWEGVDLRDADLRGSTFHLGSTRSGLVGSDVPCEGSRTGFYTDDYFDRELKDPREVRKANLCGADLRGANIEDVDFYLVDLRGAKYTPSQAEWLLKCRAIL